MRDRTLQTALVVGAILASVTASSQDGAAQVIRSGPPTCKAIALTFDMCPVRDGAGYDAPLIDTLVSKHIPATFFLSGRWVATHEAEVRALLSVPFFEIGTHGQLHAHLPMLDADRQRREIQGPVTLLQTRYGRSAPLFRPPYGEYDERTERADEGHAGTSNRDQAGPEPRFCQAVRGVPCPSAAGPRRS